ncbi:uncharacterized protein LOC131428866 [Malaya genurostris]|uniref:uncharacterized protein LOC131428866 n=1 Tax=Malaya genurostris TaxID=325434 RepID=UPI0026F3F7CA|nr:uncharacterized protein LOC131428866 [Malaya genurostris]
MVVSMLSLEDSLERFWKTEELTTKDNYSSEERHCESCYQSTVSRNSEGRYIVRYPRKPNFNVMLVQTYELLTVTYGLGPSSYLATRTLQQLTEDEGISYSLAGAAIKKCFYVDDFIGGAQTIEETIRLRTELSDLLHKGGFTLRKWTSNQLEVLQGLPNDEIGTQSALHFSPNETIKALGISWEPEADHLRFDSQIRCSNEPPTKRTILWDIAKLFDPLGLIAPVVVRAKILMQELWLLLCGWDDPVPEPIKTKWGKYYHELANISENRVDRYAFLPDSVVQLHTFADASIPAYGACTYVRCESKGEVKIRLLASKTRVAPLKRISIPRSELCAAVLAAHVHAHIKKAIDVNVSESYFWSDTSVTLHWLRSPPNVWPNYVANRVSEIQQLTHGRQWKHVPGCENPADLASRGMSVDEFLKNDIWISGPTWLSRPLQDWPESIPPSVSHEELEIKTTVAVTQITPTVHPWFLRWSSYGRLLHVIGYCMRFVNNTRAKIRTQPPISPEVIVGRTLTVNELAKSKTFPIRLAQNDEIVAEISKLDKNKSVSKRSHIRQMTPFLDAERVLRVGGRLNFAQLPYQAKHPALIPTNHPFTRLIVEDFHRKLLHGGGRLLLTAIREEFWPLNGRRLVRNVVRNCFRCTRLNPVPAQQQIGQLPVSRVIPSRPFSVTGVDYAGPLYLRPIHKRAAPAKAYLCVFVCFSTKAVHLELVSDLSTQAFLCSLRRFIVRRDRPAHIHSDNGKNFEGAKNDLTELFTMLKDGF